MTISSTVRKAGPFTGDGVVTAFPFSFKVFSAADLLVVQSNLSTGVESPKTLTTDYTVVLNADQNATPGGTLTMLVAPPVGTTLTFTSQVANTQSTDLTNAGGFYPKVINDALDRATIQIQQLGEKIGRLLGFPLSDSALSTTMPGAATRANKLLGFDGTGAPVVVTPSTQSASDVSLQLVNSSDPTKGSALVGFLQAGTGAVGRTVQDKLRDAPVAVGDFGATFGSALAASVAASSVTDIPPGAYSNTTTPVTVPLNKGLQRRSAIVASSGAGSLTMNGTDISVLNNPSAWSSWTSSPTYNFEGFAVDVGGYGPRQFGSAGLPSAVAGAINVPASSTLPGHGSGLAGYARSASTATGAVPIFSQGDCAATNALVWGINTVTQDKGFATTVWGAEVDLNISNAATVVLGVEVVGGSTVEPGLAKGFNVNALGAFVSPKKRWSVGFNTNDGAAQVGLAIGAILEAANSSSQPIQMFFMNGAATRQQAFNAQSDGGGNFSLKAAASGSFFNLTTMAGTVAQITLQDNKLSFFGQTPAAKPTVTGAKGGNAALTSLLAALGQLGLITDSTT